jgi:hypothetical protein
MATTIAPTDVSVSSVAPALTPEPTQPTLNTTAPSPPAAPDATESEFLFVALTTSAILVLVFGCVIIGCKRLVWHNSAAARRQRELEQKTEGQSLARKVWALVDTRRDQELKAASTAKVTDVLLGGDGNNSDDDDRNSDSDDDVGYADFSHCLPVVEGAVDLVSPEDQRFVRLAMEEQEHRHARRVPSHVPHGRVSAPLDFIRRTFSDTRGFRDPFEDPDLDNPVAAAASPSWNTASQFAAMPPSSLPWLPGQGGMDGAAWADGLDLHLRIQPDAALAPAASRGAGAAVRGSTAHVSVSAPRTRFALISQRLPPSHTGDDL